MAVSSWVVVVVLVVAGASTALLTAVGWRNREVVGADWFVAMMALSTVWMALSILEEFLVDPDLVSIMELCVLILVVSIPVLWLSFVLEYTGYGHVLDSRTLGVMWLVPGAAILSIVTFPWNTLYITADHPIRTGTTAVVEPAPGPMAWVNLAYFGVVVLVGCTLLLRMVGTRDRLFTGQAFGLLVGTAIPVAVTGLAVVGMFPPDLPAVPMGLSAFGLAYGYTLFNHRLLDLVPASRRIGVRDAFDDLGEGVVVVDVDGDVVAINDCAAETFRCDTKAVLGAPLDRVSSALADVDSQADRVDVQTSGRVFDVSVSTVRDSRDRETGHAFVVRDVTEDRHRKQRLDVLSRVFRHNIRNTMNGVVGPAAVLVDQVDESDRQTVETVLDAGETVVTLSEKVREIESMMTREVSAYPISVSDMLDDVIVSTRNEVDFEVETEVPLDLRLRSDPGILGVVLRNAVENAAEHSPGDRPTVSITAEPRADGCLIHVTDDGPGIPESELDALRTGAETALEHGSGLGLWAIHWGLTRLGGAVRFDRPSNGTRVSIWVPPLDENPSNSGSATTSTGGDGAPFADEEWFGTGTPPPSSPWDGE